MVMTEFFLAILVVANCAMLKLDGQQDDCRGRGEKHCDFPFPRRRKLSAAEGKAAFVSSSRSIAGITLCAMAGRGY